MKPTKNRFFCPDCGKTKMLFQSESKAMNFIKFNAKEIAAENEQGKMPTRAYFCEACAGWHLTSSEEMKHITTPTQKAIRKMRKMEDTKEKNKAIRKQYLMEHRPQCLSQVDRAKYEANIYFGAVDGLIKEINIYGACSQLIAGIKQLIAVGKEKIDTDIQQQIEMATTKLDKILEVYSDSIKNLIDNYKFATEEGHYHTLRRTVKLIPNQTDRLKNLKAKYYKKVMELSEYKKIVVKFMDLASVS